MIIIKIVQALFAAIDLAEKMFEIPWPVKLLTAVKRITKIKQDYN